MSEAVDQRFAPPQAHVADLAPGEMELAGRGTRLLAAIVDGLIGAGLGWAVTLIPAVAAMVAAQGTPGFGSLNYVSVLIGLPIFLIVQGVLLLQRGQTIGKILFKLRIVRPDGSKPDAWRLLGLRYGIGIVVTLNAAVAMIYGLIDSLLIFRESRKCLHDSIADTQVIKV
jgi:uncharacterized RDD family membrane protein YckC